MNTDIRIHIEFWDHAKTRMMIRTLGPWGPICLQRLWCYAAKHRTDGVLRGMGPESIEIAAGWPEDRQGEFFEYCSKNGWLDRVGRGTVKIHEWENYNPWAAEFGARSSEGKLGAHKRHHVMKGVLRPATCRYCKELEEDPYDRGAIGGLSEPIRGGSYAPSPSPTPSPTPSPIENQCVAEEGDSFSAKKEFPSRWELYPEKVGKKAAERSFRASVKSPADLARFDRALKNYSEFLLLNPGRPPQNGSTFFANWQDEKWQKPPRAEGPRRGTGDIRSRVEQWKREKAPLLVGASDEVYEAEFQRFVGISYAEWEAGAPSSHSPPNAPEHSTEGPY